MRRCLLHPSTVVGPFSLLHLFVVAPSTKKLEYGKIAINYSLTLSSINVDFSRGSRGRTLLLVLLPKLSTLDVTLEGILLDLLLEC